MNQSFAERKVKVVMSFLIKKTVSNGYRCGCCHYSYHEKDLWLDDHQAAIDLVPTEKSRSESDSEVEEIRVLDASQNGVEIASATLSWPRGFGIGVEYSYSRWFGYKTMPDGSVQTFDNVYYEGKKINTPWDQIIDGLKCKKAQKRVEEATSQLKAAEAELQAALLATTAKNDVESEKPLTIIHQKL